MTRDDVATLVIRTFALWLGAVSVGGIGAMAAVTPPPGVGRAEVFMISAIPLVAAVVVWLAAGTLARAMFARPDRDVAFALSARSVPALASFVAGLITMAGALPEVVSWVAMQYMLSRGNDSVFGSASLTDSLNLQSAGSGAGLVARVIVGAGLLALSRRPNFWPIPEDDADAAPDTDTPAADA